MRYWTFAEIKAKVLRDLDMEGETFVNEFELMGYANEAIDEVERQIHLLCEDYFVTKSTISLIDGQEEYDLPANIYAMKIRHVGYRDGSSYFKLNRIKNWYKFENYEFDKINNAADLIVGYFILNSTPGFPKIVFTPPPKKARDLSIWYIRNANAITSDASICDIPEAANYVMAYIKMKCMEKELHPNLQKAVADVDRERADTIAALSEMYADNETEIEPDFRLYNGMIGDR